MKNSPRRSSIPRALSATAIMAITAGFVLVATAPSVAEDDAPTGTTYYVDNAADAGCDDAGPGTSDAAPWCTFDPVDALTLGAGDALLLARGSRWDQELSIRATGTAEHPARVGAYGDGAAPRIGATDTGMGVRVHNPSHLTVSDLEIGDTDASGRGVLQYGLMVDVETPGREGLVLEDLVLRDNRIVGGFVRNLATVGMDEAALTGLVLRDIETTGNGHGIVLASQGTVTGLTEDVAPGSAGENVFRDVLVEGLYAHGDDNNNPPPAQVFAQIDAGCPDALAISWASDVVVRDSVIDGGAACRTNSGTAAVFLGRVGHALLANNVFVNTPNTRNPDMVAIDHESMTSDVVIAGNYFADNFGGAVEYLAIHGPKDFSVDNQTIANTFVGNGYVHTIPYPGAGAVGVLGGGITVEATVADNIAYEPYALVTAKFDGHTDAFTITNNKLVDSAADVSAWAAAYDVEGSPWTAQRHVDGSWESLTADGAGFTAGSTAIGRSTVQVGDADAAAFAWTAPRDGVISLRGYALSTQGDATVAVLRDDDEITSSSVDTAGRVIGADRVAVDAGDVIRFSVVDATSPVSWMPAVAYTEEAAGADAFGEWSFAVGDDTQGWSGDGIAVSEGRLTIPGTSGGAAATSAQLDLSAAVSGALRLEYVNRSGSTGGRVLFTTADDDEFRAERSVRFNLNPAADHGVIEGVQSIVVPLDAHPDWTGTIGRIRVEFDDVADDERIEIATLALTAPVRAWEFDDDDGWSFLTDAKCPSPGTPSADPVIDIDNGADGFAQYADLNWSVSRAQIFHVSTPDLARVDFWTFKTGDLVGCLQARIIEVTDPSGHGEVLFTGSIDPAAVSTTGGFVSIHPGLTGLDPSATYALQLSNPYTLPGAGAYGVGYSDDPARPLSGSGEYYAVDNNGTWNGPETNRSLIMRTYTAAEIAPAEGEPFVPATTLDGSLVGPGGYEPVLRSPDGLGVAASDGRYLHIRMTNPDNRLAAYVLFTTADDPQYDIPSDGTPPGNEQGKGLVFALVPGAEPHEYVLDMSTAEGWTGTIEQIAVYPSFRSTYRIIGDLNATWNGSIDYVRLESGIAAAEQVVTEVPGGETAAGTADASAGSEGSGTAGSSGTDGDASASALPGEGQPAAVGGLALTGGALPWTLLAVGTAMLMIGTLTAVRRRRTRRHLDG